MKINNYTQISNEFIDKMHLYSGSAVKIFFAISRKTIGWHKMNDRISYSQLRKITGLSINSIKSGIKELLKDKWIIQKNLKRNSGYIYDLNIENNKFKKDKVSKNDIDIEEEYQKMIQDVSKNDIDEYQNLIDNMSNFDTTKEINKKINKKTIKRKFRDNIFLFQEEHEELVNNYGINNINKVYNFFSHYKKEKPNYKTDSDYHTIIRWVLTACKIKKKSDNNNNKKQQIINLIQYYSNYEDKNIMIEFLKNQDLYDYFESNYDEFKNYIKGDLNE